MKFYLRNITSQLNILTRKLNKVGFRGYYGRNQRIENIFIYFNEPSGYGVKSCLASMGHHQINHIGNTPISINVVNYLSNFL